MSPCCLELMSGSVLPSRIDFNSLFLDRKHRIVVCLFPLPPRHGIHLIIPNIEVCGPHASSNCTFYFSISLALFPSSGKLLPSSWLISFQLPENSRTACLRKSYLSSQVDCRRLPILLLPK